MTPDPRTESTREFLRALASDFVHGGREQLEPFIDGIAHDIEQLWTVPVDRQDEFLERMELQARALPELARLSLIYVSHAAFLRMTIAALRFAVRVAL